MHHLQVMKLTSLNVIASDVILGLVPLRDWYMFIKLSPTDQQSMSQLIRLYYLYLHIDINTASSRRSLIYQ